MVSPFNIAICKYYIAICYFVKENITPVFSDLELQPAII
jgi:hypothetical protein